MMRKKVVVLKKTEGSGARTRTRVGSVVHYVECRKNHAAKFGGFAVDGCREFMATGEDGTEEAFFCDACGCHRSFHRREVNAEVVIEYHHPPNPNH